MYAWFNGSVLMTSTGEVTGTRQVRYWLVLTTGGLCGRFHWPRYGTELERLDGVDEADRCPRHDEDGDDDKQSQRHFELVAEADPPSAFQLRPQLGRHASVSGRRRGRRCRHRHGARRTDEQVSRQLATQQRRTRRAAVRKQRLALAATRGATWAKKAFVTINWLWCDRSTPTRLHFDRATTIRRPTLRP